MEHERLDPLDLMRIPEIPPGCVIRGELEPDTMRMRFQASKPVFKWFKRKSQWSGWFDVAEGPALLQWELFW